MFWVQVIDADSQGAEERTLETWTRLSHTWAQIPAPPSTIYTALASHLSSLYLSFPT